MSCGEIGTVWRLETLKQSLFHRNLLRNGVEGRLWLPVLACIVTVVLIGDGKVAEVEAFAFGSG